MSRPGSENQHHGRTVDGWLHTGDVGRLDEKSGEEIVAVVALHLGATATPDELIEHAQARLARYKYPREVEIVEAVPLTSVGKTDRKAVRAG